MNTSNKSNEISFAYLVVVDASKYNDVFGAWCGANAAIRYYVCF